MSPRLPVRPPTEPSKGLPLNPAKPVSMFPKDGVEYEFHHLGIPTDESRRNEPSSEITLVETEDLEAIARLETLIPEFPQKLELETLQARLSGRPHLCLLALEDDRPIAYKVGYQETPNRFYSWIGAVLPEYRGCGIARRLLHRQEEWVRAQGYGEINVWSENRYRGMLVFLLKEGYDIFAVAGDGKVLFRKRL